MTSRQVLAVAALALSFGLTACESGDNTQTETTADAQTTSQAPTAATPTTDAAATPVAVEATPEQLASVIAGELSFFREVIDKAGDCRFLWATGGSTTIEEIEASTCYVDEVTSTLRAEITARDLRELTPPASMQSLYADTLSVLDDLAAVEIESTCGDPFDGPIDTEECSQMLGSLYNHYNTLDRILESWGPYL